MKITRIIFMCLCMLAISQLSFAGFNEMYIDPFGYFNFGEVEIGSSAHGYFMAANIGVASAMWVNYRILEGGSPCFTVIVYDSWPVLAMDTESYWIEIVFSPISVGKFTAVVEFTGTSYIPGDPVYYPVQLTRSAWTPWSSSITSNLTPAMVRPPFRCLRRSRGGKSQPSRPC